MRAVSVGQVIRPTGLISPPVEIRPARTQVVGAGPKVRAPQGPFGATVAHPPPGAGAFGALRGALPEKEPATAEL